MSENAVKPDPIRHRVVREIFDLPQTGVVDYPTWYEISDIYMGVTRIAEPG